MSREDRPWEQRAPADGQVTRSAGAAIGLAYLMAQGAGLMFIGGWLGGIIGFVVGVILMVTLSRLVVSSQRPRSRPPTDLL